MASLFLSCENNAPILDANNLLLGFWIEPVYHLETITFQRANALPKDNYGVSFSENGEFIERSSGWCGTPPLTFIDYKGSYQTDKSLIKVTTQNFPNNFQWRVLKVSEKELVVKRELSEQEKDHQNLITLFDEIQNSAYNISCTDSNQWKFVAYGSKACGGPQGFIPYSTQIDTTLFLQKIAAYTEAEKKYNLKWSIVSTCDVVKSPTAVICKNGFPYLIY